MSFAEVVPDTRSPLLRDAYTYSVPEELEQLVIPGARVEVPFGTRSLIGYVVERTSKSTHAEVRSIAAVLDEAPLLPPAQIALGRWVAERYCAPLSDVIRAMVPAGVRGARAGANRRGPRTTSRAVGAARAPRSPSPAPVLTGAQRTVLQPLLEALSERRHRRVLLHGVTGSGKTEVYLGAIEAALTLGRRAIVLVPEIALTPQTVERFAGRFPGRVAVLHSGLSEAERAAEWLQIRAGARDVVVGSRSAVFAPLPGLGIVVVDEEDSSAYKQDRVPRYHAVEAALRLGEICSVPVVLGSATPRVETFYRAHTGGLELASLPGRVTGRELPGIQVVDLREELRAGNTAALSAALVRELEQCHGAGGQSILFLNRRGMSTVVLCRRCGHVLTCTNCSVALVHHRDRETCDCHYCGLSAPLPGRCPSCFSAAIRGLGLGTERLEHEVRDRFPGLRLLRMDRDTTQSRDAHYEIFEKFRDGEADCLIGTQMLAKGWDLGNVRLVGIVNADISLHFPDYRSGEITFALLTQVAGRAGRGGEAARVVLQTYNPDHYAIRHATTHDYLGFARDEIRVRRALRFPPYTRLVVCTYAHRDDCVAETEARRMAQHLSDTLPAGDGLDILGPTPAFLHRLRGQYRWQVTVRGQAVERTFAQLPRGRGWAIDVDPAT